MGETAQDIWNSEGAIQLHDATIRKLVIDAGGVISIELEGVTRYRPASDEQHAVLVYPATLTIRGATAVAVQGRWTKDDDDYVMNDEVFNADGEEIPWLRVPDQILSRIRLSLFSGAVIEIRCTGAALELSGEGEFVGHWDGKRMIYPPQ